MSLTGNLKTVTFPDLLQLIATGRKTGTVAITRGEAKKEIYFKDGNVLGASSYGADDDLLGNIILKSGKVSKGDLQRALFVHRTSGKKIGQTLVEMGLVTRDELKVYLRRHVESLIYDLFSWKDGEFILREGDLPDRAKRTVELSTMSIVMEGSRRIDEWSQIQELMPDDNQVLVINNSPEGKLQEVRLSLEEFKIVTLIDGHRTVGELLMASPLGDFDTSSAVYRLMKAGLVEVASQRRNSTSNPREEESLFWLLLRVYGAAFGAIQKMLERKLGPENRRLTHSLAEYKKGIWSYFTDSNHADFPASFEALKRTLSKIPREVRVLKLVAGLNQILEQQLSMVYSLLGRDVRRQVAGEIRKEVTIPLAERKEVDTKYGIGNDLHRILKEIKLTAAEI
ncbi:MAG: DUF4388 domain-containing protein [bacterium]